MDWGNDYLTFADTNIEYIWRFLKTLHEQDALQGPPGDRMVPPAAAPRSPSTRSRCRASIEGRPACSSVSPRRPGGRVAGRLTTTPWTSANVATVHPEHSTGAAAAAWVAIDRHPDEDLTDIRPGSELEGGPTGARSTTRAGAGVEHRGPLGRSPMDRDRIVHIAPAVVARTSTSSARASGSCRSTGRPLHPQFGWLAGRTPGRRQGDHRRLGAGRAGRGGPVRPPIRIAGAVTPAHLRVADDGTSPSTPFETTCEANSTVE